MERYHIIPNTLGGKDVPENLVLLCPRCHAEGPNVTDPEIMWDWIKAYKVPFYNTFWIIKGMEEYEFIYGSSLLEDIKDIVRKANYPDLTKEMEATVKQVMNDVYKEASVHFGQPYLNTATVAGLYRIMLKRIAKKVNSETR